MKINQISNINPNINQNNEAKRKQETSFGEMFNGFVKDVNSDQMKSKQLTKDFINGEDVEVHEVMIAGQKAKTKLDLLMEIRNKGLDMYKELTRMQ